jgi:hypothetical protein
MTTWATFRNTLRQSMLADLDEANFTDEVLLDCYTFALDTLCAHTALPKSTQFSNTVVKETVPSVTYYDMSADVAFELPADMYEPLDVSGQLSIVQSDGRVQYPDPVKRTPGLSPYKTLTVPGYWVWPENILNLSEPAGDGAILTVDYFAYYPAPVLDTDQVLHPRWANTAMQYLAAAHALSSYSVQSASIDRFKDKYDSGNPEQNSLRVQQIHFINMYERELARRLPQDRTNFFRSESMSPNAYR